MLRDILDSIPLELWVLVAFFMAAGTALACEPELYGYVLMTAEHAGDMGVESATPTAMVISENTCNWMAGMLNKLWAANDLPGHSFCVAIGDPA